MIAVNKELLENSILVNEAKDLKSSGFISKGQLQSIEEKLPVLKSQKNLLVRIGFFLLGLFLFSSILGTLSLLSLSALDGNFNIMFFVYAAIGFVGCEILAKQNFHGYGLDDAFVLSAQTCLFGAFGIATESPMAVFIVMAIVGAFCCLRYIHALSALISCIGIVGFCGDLIIEHHIASTTILPFIMLFLAVVLYVSYTKLLSISTLYYRNSLYFVQAFALVLGYLSMNYLVVRELSEALMNLVIAPGSDIPFAFLFYGLTFLIPLFYISYSLFIKDKLMLLIGLVALGFSFYTIRHYYALMPIEIALMLGGTVLFAVSYFSIRRLRNNTSGITFIQDRNENNTVLSNLEAVIVNSQVSLKGVAPAQQNMPFGGGDFSGGGSGGSY